MYFLKAVTICIISVVASYAGIGDTLVVYPMIPGFGPSEEYTLSVNGQDVPVFKHLSTAIAQFAFAGKADLVIKLKNRTSLPSQYSLSPKRITWNQKVTGNTMSFSITTPRYIVLHYGATKLTQPHYQGMDHAEGVTEKLFIFAMPIETESPKPGDQGVVALSGMNIQSALDNMPEGGTLYIGPGSYKNAAIAMRSNKRVYLSQGAKLNFGFTFGAIKNARVFGRGAIDMEGAISGTGIRLSGSQNCQADDLLHIRRGYGIHVYWTGKTSGNSFRNMKLVTDEKGRTGCNTDGFDPNNGPKDDTVSNAFVYITDDPTAPGFQESMEGFVFKNSVLWNHGCGRALKVGAQQGGNVYSRFCWENIDAIASEWPIKMTWQGSSGTPTVFHHFYIKNIHNEALTRSFWGMEGSDAWDVYFMGFHAPYFGGRSQGFYSDKITNTTVQHVVVGGKVMQSMAEAKMDWNSSTQNITFRTDKPVEVNVTANSLYASRSPVTPALFRISRIGGNNARALTLEYTINGSARNGVDYNSIPGKVTIPEGASFADIAITPKSGVSGGIKTVLLEMQHVSDTTYMLGADFQAQLSIIPSGIALKSTIMPDRNLIGGRIMPRVIMSAAELNAAGNAAIKIYTLQGKQVRFPAKNSGSKEFKNSQGILICQPAAQRK